MPNRPSEREVDAQATLLIAAALDAAVATMRQQGGSDAHGASAAMPAMNVLCARLGVHLTRWVGADGWHALLRRGLDEAVRTGGVKGLAVDVNSLLRWTDEARSSDTRAACVQVLVGVSRVLTRFIGPEMSLRLMEQGVAPGDGESGQGADNG